MNENVAEHIEDFSRIEYRPTKDRVSSWETLKASIDRAGEHLLSRQNDDGSWVGELHVDVTLAADCIFLYRFLERDPIPHLDDYRDHILDRQLEDGGWSIYPGGPSEINATVRSYFALKIAGLSPEDPPLQRAREKIDELGGLSELHMYTEFYLACLGQISWSNLPTIPPELLLIPHWMPINFYEFSAWSRSIIAPMTIIRSKEPVVELSEEESISELMDSYENNSKSSGFVETFYSFFFTLLDIYGKVPRNPLRSWAFDRAESWMVRRMTDGGLGAIFPSIVNSIIALWCLGYRDDHPLFRASLEELDELHVYDQEEFRIKPCDSSVWDTAWVLLALSEYREACPEAARTEEFERAVTDGTEWLMDQQIQREGDWTVKAPDVEPGGWCFEENNPWYPDVDDTCAVLMAIEEFEDHVPGAEQAIEEGRQWMLDMKNSDGGWAAFDRDIDKEWMNSIPLAEHNAILDPSAVDITGKVVECLMRSSRPVPEDIVEEAHENIVDAQRENGSWYGRWGVNYVYGTWQALEMLGLMDREDDQEVIEAGVNWLKDHQNDDGGWGESCKSYEQPDVYQAIDSTPSQTAWAVMGLIAGGAFPCDELDRGVEYLVETQQEDGTWNEELFTGTGFPRVFYLGYSMYSEHFPLIALCRYRKTVMEFSEHISDNGHALNLEFLTDNGHNI